MQLQPIIQCKRAKDFGLGVSMFERLRRFAGMLTMQYRMVRLLICFKSVLRPYSRIIPKSLMSKSVIDQFASPAVCLELYDIVRSMSPTGILYTPH